MLQQKFNRQATVEENKALMHAAGTRPANHAWRKSVSGVCRTNQKENTALEHAAGTRAARRSWRCSVRGVCRTKLPRRQGGKAGTQAFGGAKGDSIVPRVNRDAQMQITIAPKKFVHAHVNGATRDEPALKRRPKEAGLEQLMKCK